MGSPAATDQEEATGSVLVVTREASRYEGYAAALLSSGFEPVESSGRADALTRLKNIDLVLFEVGRLDPEGWDFCRQVRSRFKTLPIIGITERAEGDLVEQLLEAGVDDHLSWPHRPEALVARVRARILRNRTAKKKAQKSKRRREEYFQSLIEGTHEIIALVDGEGSIRYASPSLAQTLGRTRRTLEGEPVFNFVHADDRRLWDALLDGMADGSAGFTGRCRLRNANGEFRLFELTARDHLSNPAVAGIVVNARDVTDRQAAEDALRASEARFRLIVEGSRDVFFYVRDDAGIFTYLSPSVDGVLGAPAEKLVGRPIQWEGEPAGVVVSMNPGGSTTRIASVTHGQGYTVILELVESELSQPDGSTAIQGLARDVSERERMQRMLREAAFQDGLTTLPNRALFTDRVRHAITRTRRNPNHAFALLFLDLDRFKIINDSLGHRVGDQLLIAVADRLRDHLRPEDTLARFGGDEFAILLEDVAGLTDAPRVARRISEALAPPFHLSGYEIHTSASVGIVLGSALINSPEALLENADMAMYRAKSNGGGSFEVYDQEMHAEAMRRLQLESQLRKAVERQELCLYFEPVISLEDGAILGAEAAMRWDHPVYGVIAPADVLKLAEETGYIATLAQWAIGEACEKIAQWQDASGRDDLFVSVNISSRQLRDSTVVEHVREAIARHAIPAQCLRLEVSESLLGDGRERSLRILREIRALGVEIMLDDFGAAYGSLSNLRSLPISGVKLDRSLVGQLPHDGRAVVLTHGVIEIARAFQLRVIADGVSDANQARALSRLGCHIAQGSLYSEPISAVEFAGCLTEQIPAVA